MSNTATARRILERIFELNPAYSWSYIDNFARTGSVYLYLRKTRDGLAYKIRFSDHDPNEGGCDLDWNGWHGWPSCNQPIRKRTAKVALELAEKFLNPKKA